MKALEKRFAGNNALFKDILDLFLEEARVKLQELDQCAKANDAKGLGAALHSITNIASHVLAMDIVDTSRLLERLCHRGELDKVLSRLSDLKSNFEALIKEVEQVAATM